MSSPLERLWKDKMSVFRFVNVVVNNISKSVEQPMGSNIKCQYSKGSLTDTGAEGVPTLINSYTLFCSLETDIKEGDKVVVTQRNGKQITLAAGEGFPYSGHLEFSVKRNGTA